MNNVKWKALKGSQTFCLNLPNTIDELLLEGNRGSGKTATMLAMFEKNVGKGWGAAYRGLVLRSASKGLKDIIAKSKEIFPIRFPTAQYIGSEGNQHWRFPDGETIHFGYGSTDSDYESKFHGQEYCFVAFDELTNWPDMEFYGNIKTLWRSTAQKVIKGITYKIPMIFMGMTNPYGPGHQWVKDRFECEKDPREATVIKDQFGQKRLRVHCSLLENTYMDKKYLYNLLEMTKKNKAKMLSWVFGRWDIVAGGYFDGYYTHEHNVVDDFSIPSSWKIYRSYDHGSAHPFSVGWHAVSNGETVTKKDGSTMGTIKGDIFRIFEWYGCENGETNKGLRMKPSDIAEEILRIEASHGWRVRAGAADSAIWNKDSENTIYSYFEEQGVYFVPCVKGPGSRINGWEAMKDFLSNAELPFVERREKKKKAYYVFKNTTRSFQNIILTIMQDPKKMDDLDTESADHIFDEARYFITTARYEANFKSIDF